MEQAARSFSGETLAQTGASDESFDCSFDTVAQAIEVDEMFELPQEPSSPEPPPPPQEGKANDKGGEKKPRPRRKIDASDSGIVPLDHAASHRVVGITRGKRQAFQGAETSHALTRCRRHRREGRAVPDGEVVRLQRGAIAMFRRLSSRIKAIKLADVFIKQL